jgi:hypothetical protein
MRLVEVRLHKVAGQLEATEKLYGEDGYYGSENILNNPSSTDEAIQQIVDLYKDEDCLLEIIISFNLFKKA